MPLSPLCSVSFPRSPYDAVERRKAKVTPLWRSQLPFSSGNARLARTHGSRHLTTADLLFFSQTSEGEDGPTETDGQREHHHRHGKGERTGNLLRAEGGRDGKRRASERAREHGAENCPSFTPLLPSLHRHGHGELRVAATRQAARPDNDRACAPLFYLIEH